VKKTNYTQQQLIDIDNNGDGHWEHSLHLLKAIPDGGKRGGHSPWDGKKQFFPDLGKRQADLRRRDEIHSDLMGE